MKKAILPALVLLYLMLTVPANAQNWLWADQPVYTGNPPYQSNGEGIAVVTDANGNNYQTGYFAYSSMRYGNTTLTTVNPCMFLVKRDANGNILWARQSVLNTLSDLTQGNSIAMDPHGNVYITGLLRGTAQFGPYSVTSSYSSEMFMVKYDPSGTVQWVRTSSTTSFTGRVTRGMAITSDRGGHIYITGEFNNTVSFGSVQLSIPPGGEGSVFLAKYDTSGNVIWVRQANIPSSNSSGMGKAVTVDRLNNVYITGSFRDSITFGNTPMLNCTSAVADIFVAKYDQNGNALWAKQSTNRSTSYWSNGPIAGNGITTDRAGNVYIAGNFEDTLFFGATMLINPIPFSISFPYGNMLIAKYDASGNFQWAKAGEPQNSGSHCGWSIVADDFDRLYFLGTGFNFNGTKQNYSIKFGGQTYAITGPASIEFSMILQLDTGGNVLCGAVVPVGGDDYCTVSVDPLGQYIYLASDQYAQFNVIIGPDTLRSGIAINQGLEIPYVLRWQACNTPLPILIDIAKSNNSCNGQCNGSATANASGGGSSTYTYLWNTNPVRTTPSVNGLCAGSYNVTVTDSLGTTAVTTVVITQPDTLSVTTSADTSLCNGGSAILSPCRRRRTGLHVCVVAAGGLKQHYRLYSYRYTP